MASLNGNSNRKSYFLSVTPVDYSLTAGTNIPSPSEPLPHSLIEPPTPGGGPLTSHPTTPPDSGMMDTRRIVAEPNRGRTSDSFRTPTSPASAAQYSSSPQTERRPKGVRKLLSLSSLRGSFSSSRTSLTAPRDSNDVHRSNGRKRPSSPSIYSTPASSVAPAPQQLRHKKSGNWFKRKSGIFMLNEDLDPVNEDHRPDTRESKRLKENEDYRPDTRESKRLREWSPAPLLPDIGLLGGGGLGGGDLGWDENAFKA